MLRNRPEVCIGIQNDHLDEWVELTPLNAQSVITSYSIHYTKLYDALSFRDTWRAWCAKMHADRYHDRIRCINADGACLCQRFSFTDVMKGMNTASKRVPQFNPPTLSNTGVQLYTKIIPTTRSDFFFFPTILQLSITLVKQREKQQIA